MTKLIWREILRDTLTNFHMGNYTIPPGEKIIVTLPKETTKEEFDLMVKKMVEDIESNRANK